MQPPISFVRIRSRDVTDQIVRYFDLVTNSGPAVLQLDPVQVTYDLAAANTPRELTIETPSFQRRLFRDDVDFDSTDSNDSEFVLPDVEGERALGRDNGRVERVSWFGFEVLENTLSNAVEIVVTLTDTRLIGTSNIFELMRADIQAGFFPHIYRGVPAGTGLNTSGQRYRGGQHPFSGIVVSPEQFVEITISETGGAPNYSGDIRIAFDFIYEWREV
jgi:hypothetical protein